MRILAFLLLAAVANAQELPFPEAAASDDAALARAMPELATRLLADFRDADRETDLDNRFRLQLVAGEYAEAAKSVAAVREIKATSVPGGGAWVSAQYEIFARAKAGEGYERAFHDVVDRMSDRDAALLFRAMGSNVAGLQRTLQSDRDPQKGKTTIARADALRLVRDYAAWDAYRTFAPLAAPLIAADDARRYEITRNLAVPTVGGATVCTLIVRPRVARRQPALLEFTIYAAQLLEEARLAAAHGYVGVVALTRGKGCSAGPVVPYVHDGADAAALLDWIAAQPWSDGRAGMFSGSYNGFTAWAAAKYRPKALKAIAVGAPARPGIDVPMEGNVVWNFIYPWPFYATNLKDANDVAVYNDATRWNRLNHDWYVSGRAYRDLEKIDGTPNPIFDEWISHPAYDAYWQSMVPGARELAQLDIAVLQTAGYYGGGPGAAVPYWQAYERAKPNANDVLLIGPYDHVPAQIGVVSLSGNVNTAYSGMTLDPVARINIEELRFQFFDHVFKDAPMPELLRGRVNYEVTGANVWKHAPSLAAMSNRKMRLYLSAADKRLSPHAPPRRSFAELKVDLADRSDADRRVPGGGVIDKEIDTANALVFESDPLPSATEMSGLFSGRLEVVTNKKDFDFELDFYERTPAGDYVQLSQFWTRASYLGHPSRRALLTPGRRTRLDVESIRLMSRRLEAGSRVVLVLSAIKGPDRQINYGSGKDVSDETIRDAGAPLDVHWLGGSYVELPVWR